jgi:hypothetical protein
MQMALTGSMQGASGAMGGIQGEEGPNREAATVGAMRLQYAMDRPELAGMVLENECLPPIARAILRRYQQFLPDSAALAARVGEVPEATWIGDIMGDYDVEFVGSRMAATKQEKLQSYDRLGALSAAIPELRMQIPWMEIGRDIVGRVLELPEIAAIMSDPNTVIRNMLLAQASAGPETGNGNGTITKGSPAGALPAQTSGNVTSG